MRRERIEKQLARTGGRLRRLRDELRVTEEQLVLVQDEAEDLGLRSLVSESPVVEHKFRRSRRHYESLRRHRDRVTEQITRLEAHQDLLLDRLSAG